MQKIRVGVELLSVQLMRSKWRRRLDSLMPDYAADWPNLGKRTGGVAEWVSRVGWLGGNVGGDYYSFTDTTGNELDHVTDMATK